MSKIKYIDIEGLFKKSGIALMVNKTIDTTHHRSQNRKIDFFIATNPALGKLVLINARVVPLRCLDETMRRIMDDIDKTDFEIPKALTHEMKRLTTSVLYKLITGNEYTLGSFSTPRKHPAVATARWFDYTAGEVELQIAFACDGPIEGLLTNLMESVKWGVVEEEKIE